MLEMKISRMEKYISLTKISKVTAVRDITQLVEFGCIESTSRVVKLCKNT